MSAINLDRSTFSRAMDITTHVISRASMPILETVMVRTNADKLQIRATDLDVEITATVDYSPTGEAFSVAIPAKKFQKILKDAPACSTVEATQDGNNARLRFGKANYTLNGLDASEFPERTNYGSVRREFSMSGTDLREYLSRVSPSISTEETRYYLNGIFFHEYNGAACFVATDGHRCHVQEFAAPAGMLPMIGRDQSPGIIVPREAVRILSLLLKGKTCPETVAIEAQAERITFKMSLSGIDVELSTKTVDGTFPDYRRVIPANNDKLASVVTKDLLEAIKAVTVIKEKGKGPLKFEISADVLTLRCNDPDNGNSSFQITADFNCESDFEIGFNSPYLNEMLALCGPTVQGMFSDHASPGLFKSEGLDGFTVVMMPLRV